MSCFAKFFKISMDLTKSPSKRIESVVDSVPGSVTLKNDEFIGMDSLAEVVEEESKRSVRGKSFANGHVTNGVQDVQPKQSTSTTSPAKPKEIIHDYDKLLNLKPVVVPESLAMTCNPKPTYEDDMLIDDYPTYAGESAIIANNLDEQQSLDENDRQKTDSGIETDELEEANKSVSFSEKIKILGEKDSNENQIPNETTEESAAPENAEPSPPKADEVNCESITTEVLNDAGENGTDTLRERKQGVISDSIDQKSTRDFNLDLKVYEKSAETEELIKNAIIANDFLNNMMDAERLQGIVNAMIPQVLEANSYVIKEGEIGGQLYVSAEGEYDVIKNGKCIKTFGPGVVFGELAILYKARRFASIKVTTKAFVWALDRKIFQKIMMKTGSQEREQNTKFLSSVKVLKGMSEEALLKIGDLLKREFYATGSTIIRQGDPGDKFYIIRGGSVTVTKRSNTGEVRIVGMLKRGEYFGEQALLNSSRRLASIIADEPGTECLTLDRSAFNKYLGTISELKQKPVDQVPADEGIIIPAAKSNVINPQYDHIQLSDLQIVGTLGVGGFGRVELVQYEKRETFALKILKKYEVASQGQIEHAYSEKDIMASCDSTFIVKLYKTYRNKKYLYFLMEACLGGDVWTQLQKTKFFDEKTSKFVSGCVVEAFEYLHTRGIIYRDLKPENLMIDSEGFVKLVDFGFAKRVCPNNKTWTFAGTPEYVAPEIILNKGHDRAVDYWALGVFIHELLVGKPPFRGKDHMKTYNLILRGIDVVQMPQKIPKSAQHLIKGLCRQTPTDRLGYQKKGIADVKKHAWFDGFDWAKLEDRTMAAPLKRPIKDNIDLSNFDEYPRDRDEPPDETSGWDSYF